jgi:hypothetical protein
VIEDNVFDGLDMSSILVSCDASNWYESGPVRDLTIRRNTFRHPSPNHPVIWINPENTVIDEAAPVHENIRIEDNTFESGDVMVAAKSVRNLALRNNQIPEGGTFQFTACSEIV